MVMLKQMRDQFVMLLIAPIAQLATHPIRLWQVAELVSSQCFDRVRDNKLLCIAKRKQISYTQIGKMLIIILFIVKLQPTTKEN